MEKSIPRITQLDLIKGLAIISVVLLHSIPSPVQLYILAPFHITQAVPIFLIVMGITTGIYFYRRKVLTLNDIRWKTYFKEKGNRLILPLLPIFLISALYAYYTHTFSFNPLYFIGVLPQPGPGNYFISVIIQFVIVSPFLYIAFRCRPRLCIAGTFLLSFSFETYAIFTPPVVDSYFYTGLIFRWLFYFTLGLIIFDRFILKQNTTQIPELLFLASVVSLAYLTFMYVFEMLNLVGLSSLNIISAPYNWKYATVYSAFYPAYFLAVSFSSGHPYRTWVKWPDLLSTTIRRLGKASYHIFLVQILFFGFGLSFTAANFLALMSAVASTGGAIVIIAAGIGGIGLNLAATCGIGYAYYFVEEKINKARLKRIEADA